MDSRGYSGDVDFFVRPTPDNAGRVRSALVQFGCGELDISLTDLTTPGKVIQLGYEPNRIELMTSITGTRVLRIHCWLGRILHRNGRFVTK